jgi:hypothetical protein
MNEYRVTTTTEETPLADLVAPCSRDLPVYMTLDAQYGLMEDDLEIGSSTTPEQTVEQEYQAYVTASLSPKKVDILKFWEVSREGINIIDR